MSSFWLLAAPLLQDTLVPLWAGDFECFLCFIYILYLVQCHFLFFNQNADQETKIFIGIIQNISWISPLSINCMSSWKWNHCVPVSLPLCQFSCFFLVCFRHNRYVFLLIGAVQPPHPSMLRAWFCSGFWETQRSSTLLFIQRSGRKLGQTLFSR